MSSKKVLDREQWLEAIICRHQGAPFWQVRCKTKNAEGSGQPLIADAKWREEEMIEGKGWLWKVGTLQMVGVNYLSAGTQRGEDGVRGPEEFPHRKEIWELKNGKIAA